MSATPGTPQTPTTVEVRKVGVHRFVATNARGGSVAMGEGNDPDLTPVELLLAALAGCASIDLDYLAGKRADFETFAARAQGTKVRDEQGNHVVGLRVTFDVTFPEGEAGDAAREMLPSALQRIQDRLCPVGRTVTLGEPVSYVAGSLPEE